MKDKYAATYYYKDGTTSSSPDSFKDLHRLDGPAVEYAKGDRSWYVDDKRHRVDGPAIDWSEVGLEGGGKDWWVDGEPYTEEEFNKLIEEVKELPKVLKLIDTREWVRNYER